MGESEHPASPPSTATSPELSKATPANAGKSEDKKESESWTSHEDDLHKSVSEAT